MQTAFDDDLALQAILQRLADGEFHSGQELGDMLGISRAAVWKQLQKLEPLGINLISIKGKGYCLEGGLDLLSASVIEQALAPAARGLLSRLEIPTVVGSTNAQALQGAGEWGSGYVCLAELQTAGRGRRGRSWVSPFGKNIYLSLAWTFDGGAAELEGLSLAVGVVIAEVLQDLGITDIQLKWPNDILWCGAKLGGILLEMSGDPAGVCQVVVGIGINVAMPATNAAGIDQPWVDLSSIFDNQGLPAHGLQRNVLVAALLSRLLPLLDGYHRARFAAYHARWEALNAYAGQQVEVQLANSRVTGQLIGVNDIGALRLHTDAGEQLLFGGEVSLRIQK